MNYKKQWFTLIEIMIVIIIIWTIFFISRGLFVSKDRDNLYAKSCLNNIYWELENYINSSFTSKWLWIGWNLVYPEEYYINFLPASNWINLWFKTLQNTWIRRFLNISWNLPKDFYCNTSNYFIKLTWENVDLKIQKWFKTIWTKPSFEIKKNWESKITQNILFLFCYKWSSLCKEFEIFEVDIRTKNIYQKVCIDYSWYQCLKRNK